MQTAARSMVDSAELIKKVRFPRQLVAFSMVATQAVTYAVMMAILLVLSLVFVPEARSTVWLALPLAVVFAGFVAGLALLFACLNVLYRDVEHVLAAALLPWFFLTPILWRVASLPPSAQRHHLLLDVLRFGNPVAPPIYAIRDALWSGHLPRLADVDLSPGRRSRSHLPRRPGLQPRRRPNRRRALTPDLRVDSRSNHVALLPPSRTRPGPRRAETCLVAAAKIFACRLCADCVNSRGGSRVVGVALGQRLAAPRACLGADWWRPRVA